MRSGLTRAIHHAQHRKAFGAYLIDQPLMRNVLADLAVEAEAATIVAMRMAGATDRAVRGDDREALLPREQQRRFLDSEGWIAWSGPAISELLKQFIVHNRMMTGGFVIKDQLVSLAEITLRAVVVFFDAQGRRSGATPAATAA